MADESHPALIVRSGEDRFSEQRGFGITTLQFKVVPADSDGLLVLENTFLTRGGPPRHLHYAQDEWFYVLAGEFLVEVGQEQTRLKVGDSILAPRNIPHTLANISDQPGKVLITFAPAGQMEAFFREMGKANIMPGANPEIWRAHGLKLVGPPLKID